MLPSLVYRGDTCPAVHKNEVLLEPCHWFMDWVTELNEMWIKWEDVWESTQQSTGLESSFVSSGCEPPKNSQTRCIHHWISARRLAHNRPSINICWSNVLLPIKTRWRNESSGKMWRLTWTNREEFGGHWSFSIGSWNCPWWVFF